MIVVYILLALLFILIAVVIIRTILFKPPKNENIDIKDENIDVDIVSHNLREMIKCKTISYEDETKEDYNEFLKFESLLTKLFPEVFRVCEFKKLGRKSLLFRWKGHASTKNPTVLMSHYDVVPVKEELWTYHPFEGEIIDGYLWGRGTLDTKGTLNGVLSAAEILIKEGFTPSDDIYFAFAGDEEIHGYGAPLIVDYFEEQGISPKLVVDEGGAVVNNVFPGVKESCALVGIAEKGMLETQLKLVSSGGHASSPPKHTIVGELAMACTQIENKPFKRNFPLPTKLMFDTLGRYSTFLYRMIFANMWLFAPLLDKMGKKNGGEINALFRTTVAFTQMSGSDANNVIPPLATMGINSRIMIGETEASTINHFKKVIKNKKIEVNPIYAFTPSRVSIVDSDAYNLVKKTIYKTWPNVIVSPYLMFACSDSRHYGRITPYVYRFSPMKITNEERATIHGNNERISLEGIKLLVEFYVRLMREC